MGQPKGQGLLTAAIGKKFAKQAQFLSLSCMIHAPHIIRAVISDCPGLLGEYYDIIIPYDPLLGNPFAVKTRLHLYTPFRKTLFLDADSLVSGPLDSCWTALDSSPFIYTGKPIQNGIWYYDVGKILEKIQVSWIPDFNSGMMLFEHNETVCGIFDTAFDYMHRADELNVPFFRKDMLPDEPFMAIALARHNIAPFEDYGRFSKTLIGAKNIHINIIKGISRFVKQGKQVFPLVVHFCGRLGCLLYLRERTRLRLYFYSLPDFLFTRMLLFLRKIVKGL